MKKLFWILLVLFACTKSGKNISITGFVKNPVTGAPYSDVEIRLLKIDSGLPGGYKSVQTVHTNNDGYFEIHHLGGSSEYYLSPVVTPSLHHGIAWYSNQYLQNGAERLLVEKGSWMDPTFHMVGYGELKVNIHNVSCEGPTDVLVLERDYITDPFTEVYQPINIDGCYSANGVPAEVPSGYYEIRWAVVRISGTTSGSDIVFVPEGGLGEYTLNY